MASLIGAFLRILSFSSTWRALRLVIFWLYLSHNSTHSAHTIQRLYRLVSIFFSLLLLKLSAFEWNKKSNVAMTKKCFRCLNTWVLYTTHQKWFINFLCHFSFCFSVGFHFLRSRSCHMPTLVSLNIVLIDCMTQTNYIPSWKMNKLRLALLLLRNLKKNKFIYLNSMKFFVSEPAIFSSRFTDHILTEKWQSRLRSYHSNS